MAALWAVSCAYVLEDMDTTADDGSIVLHFQTPGVAVKGTIEDNACESYMSHLDVLIYEYENSSYTPFHYERISVTEISGYQRRAGGQHGLSMVVPSHSHTGIPRHCTHMWSEPLLMLCTKLALGSAVSKTSMASGLVGLRNYWGKVH